MWSEHGGSDRAREESFEPGQSEVVRAFKQSRAAAAAAAADADEAPTEHSRAEQSRAEQSKAQGRLQRRGESDDGRNEKGAA